MRIGIRREDKSIWEARTPLTPQHVKQLATRDGLSVVIAPSPQRVYDDAEFASDGVTIADDLSPCPVVLGVKEIAADQFESNKTYVFFSHTIKGQPHNMAMLARMMELGCTLIDYELIADDQGRRLVFFGRHAGLAGMIDALWTYGRRLESEGVSTAFGQIRPAHMYANLAAARDAIAQAGRDARGAGELTPPFVCGFAGYGRVSQGAQEIFDLLEPVVVMPDDLAGGVADGEIYKVVYAESDMVRRIDGSAFELQDYYDHPERYESRFDEHWPRLTMLVNCIYWDSRYPRLVTINGLKHVWRQGDGDARLKVIADISCDVGGSIECNLRATDPGDPVYVYDVDRGNAVSGFDGRGPVVLAVDILPTELPRESSEAFSDALVEYIPQLAAACAGGSCDVSKLPHPLSRAVILDNGRLTDRFTLLADAIKRHG